MRGVPTSLSSWRIHTLPHAQDYFSPALFALVSGVYDTNFRLFCLRSPHVFGFSFPSFRFFCICLSFMACVGCALQYRVRRDHIALSSLHTAFNAFSLCRVSLPQSSCTYFSRMKNQHGCCAGGGKVRERTVECEDHTHTVGH